MSISPILISTGFLISSPEGETAAEVVCVNGQGQLKEKYWQHVRMGEIVALQSGEEVRPPSIASGAFALSDVDFQSREAEHTSFSPRHYQAFFSKISAKISAVCQHLPCLMIFIDIWLPVRTVEPKSRSRRFRRTVSSSRRRAPREMELASSSPR